jgi:hypothetical protein
MHALSLIFPLLAAASAQDGGVHPPSPVERLLETGQAQSGQDEMVVLFQRIEERLREIDKLLYDASAGEPVVRVQESGIAELLRTTRSKNQEVLDDMDRVLQLAQERGSKSQQQSGSTGSTGQSQGQSPPSEGGPSQGSREGSTQREQTPQGPGQERQEGQRPQGDQPQEGPSQDGREPRNGAETPADGETRPGDRPLRDGTGEGAGDDGGDGRWGDLPVHVRELFRAQGGADLPPHYRDWIDAYYRRLNRER